LITVQNSLLSSETWVSNR